MNSLSEAKSQVYLQHPEPIRSCLLSLREIMLSYPRPLTESIKYGMPCFCYGKSPVCYFWVDKQTAFPYLLFARGHLMSHPLLEQGKRKKMKSLSINPVYDLPLETIMETLEEALSLYK